MVRKILFVLFLSGQFLFSLPLYANIIPMHPKLTKIDQQNLIINGAEVQTTRYESEVAASEILSFYRDSLVNMGWKLDFQNDKQIPNILAFSNTKEERINLDIYPGEEENKCVVILTQLKGSMEPPQEDKDSKGKEPSWFIRYPNSIRQTVLEWEKGIELVYISKQSDLGVVVDFYRNQFISSGWKLQSENRTAPQNKLDISSYLPDNIKLEKNQIDAIKIHIDEQAGLVFIKGRSLLLLAISRTGNRIATTVYYFYDYKPNL